MNKLKSFASTAVLLVSSATGFTGCSDDTAITAGEQGGSSSLSTQGGTSSLSAQGGTISTSEHPTTGSSGESGTLVAAMSLNFLSGGTNCPISAGYNDFPNVANGHPVTAAGATTTTPDNVTSSRGLVRVNCGINSSLLYGSITLGGGAESMAFRISRSGTRNDNFQYQPLNSSVSYGGTAAAPCTLTAISTTATGGLYSVSCPTFTGDDGTTCVLGESFVYFSGCTLE